MDFALIARYSNPQRVPATRNTCPCQHLQKVGSLGSDEREQLTELHVGSGWMDWSELKGSGWLRRCGSVTDDLDMLLRAPFPVKGETT